MLFKNEAIKCYMTANISLAHSTCDAHKTPALFSPVLLSLRDCVTMHGLFMYFRL